MSAELTLQIPANQALRPHEPGAASPPQALDGRGEIETTFWGVEQAARWLDGVQTIAGDLAHADGGLWPGAPDPHLQFE